MMSMTKNEQISAGLRKCFESGSAVKTSKGGYGYAMTHTGELRVYSAEVVLVF